MTELHEPIPGQPAVDQVRIDVLGGLSVSRGGRPVEITGRRLRAMLTVLALSAGRALAVEQLAARVWDDGELPANVRPTVQTYVRRLRMALGNETIGTTATGYLLQVERRQVDALRFEDLTRPDTGRPMAERRTRLDQALAMWPEVLFGGQLSDWLAGPATDRLTQTYLAALEAAADLDLLAGRPDDHLPGLQQQTCLHPFRESLWHRLITALSRSGRQAEALSTYEELRSRLAEELGVDPSPELQRSHAALLQGKIGSTPPDRVPRQLPADCRDFTGRTGQLLELNAMLYRHSAENVSLVVLHGAGAIGKTTLAVHWAHHVSDRFPDGVLFLDLRGFGLNRPMAPLEALASLLSGLGIGADQIPADIDGASALFRSVLADRRVLLILDNAVDEQQVRPLLPGAGALVIVTSRNHLRGLVGRDAAQAIAVSGLDPESTMELLARHFDAAGIDWTDHELGELARLCDGYPLAVRLVVEACRVAGSPAHVIEDLHREHGRLDALATDDPLADLRSVFQASYTQLDQHTARMFRLVASYPSGGFGVDAAAALAGVETKITRRLLRRLADASLIDQLGADRYVLHDLVREFAVELAEADHQEVEEAERRLMIWAMYTSRDAETTFLGHAADSDLEWLPRDPRVPRTRFESQQQATDWFRTEGPSMIRIAEHAARGAWPLVGAGLIIRLFSYLIGTRPPAEGLRLQKLGLQATEQAWQREPEQARHLKMAEAYLRNQLGTSHGRLGAFDEAETEFIAARRLFEQDDSKDGRAGVVMTAGNLGEVYRLTGRHDEAIEAGQVSVELSVRAEPFRVIDAKVRLAAMYLAAGRVVEALSKVDELMPEVEQGTDLMRRAEVRRIRGTARLRDGDPAGARQDLLASLAIEEELRADWNQAVVHHWLAEVERVEGNAMAAAEHWRTALAIMDATGVLDESELTRAEVIDKLGRLSRAVSPVRP